MSEMREPHDERLGPDCGIKRCHFTVISTKGRNLSHAKSKFDGFVKSPKMGFFVIPAQAGQPLLVDAPTRSLVHGACLGLSSEAVWNGLGFCIMRTHAEMEELLTVPK